MIAQDGSRDGSKPLLAVIVTYVPGCTAWPEELRQPPSRFLAAVLSAAAARAQFLNLLDGITDLHLQNMFAEQGGCFGRVADVALPIS